MSLPADSQVTSRGQVVDGRFRLGQQLGSGSMGVVHEAQDLQTGSVVAVKLERVDDEGRSSGRLQREAIAMRALDTPHVVRVFASGFEQRLGVHYMAMERLRGMDLGALLEAVSALTVEATLKIGLQACRGLMVAHRAGFLHRDIKPSNLFLALGPDGAVTVKLVDFGLAKQQGSIQTWLTAAGEVVGTPHYLSPEQARGDSDIDARADMFSLGVLLHRCLVGSPPRDLDGGLVAFLETLCSEPTPRLSERFPGVRPELAAVIDCCTALDREQRYLGMEDLLVALELLMPDSTLFTRDLRSSGVPSGRVARTVDDGDTTLRKAAAPKAGGQTLRMFPGGEDDTEN